jgi:peptidoglycan hydrolase-like protein with peptidoglycan-binding domain
VRAEYEARRRAEEEARLRAEAETAAREKSDTDARRKAEADARHAAEDKARAEADVKRQAEAAEAGLRLSETDRKRVQVALTALGHNTQGSDGSFGPRTRQMIAAWQKSQNAPETGYLTATQFAALRLQAAPAIARFEEEQKKLEDDRRKAEEDVRRKDEEARRKAVDEAKRADEERRRAPPSAQQPNVAAVPSASTPATGVDGTWAGRLTCENGPTPRLTVQIAGGAGQATFTNRYGLGEVSLRITGTGVSGELSWTGREGGRPSGSLRGTVSGQQLSASGNVRTGMTPTHCTLTLSR